MSDDGSSIVFEVRQLTIGELLLLRRLEKNTQDYEALVELIVSRSNASAQTICDLPLEALEDLSNRLRDALAQTIVISQFEHVLKQAQDTSPSKEQTK